MRNLQKYVNQCLKEVEDAGIEHNEIDKFVINKRAIGRYGRCIKKNNKYTIEVSESLLDERVPVLHLKNTIIHEILHSCDGCMNHGKKWQDKANVINQKYEYGIARTSSCKEFKTIVEEKQPYKYIVQCQKCNKEYKRRKMSKVIKNPDCYRCKCGGKLKRIK